MAGTATFVLHTHLPYCRLAGRWPHGEEWIHEALLECYLPLLRAFQDLSASVDGSLGVTLNLTPILAEQLRDPLVQQHFGEYLGERLRPGLGVDAAYQALRKVVKGLDGDRFLAPDLAAAERLVRDGTLVVAAEKKVGPLVVCSSTSTRVAPLV